MTVCVIVSVCVCGVSLGVHVCEVVDVCPSVCIDVWSVCACVTGGLSVHVFVVVHFCASVFGGPCMWQCACCCFSACSLLLCLYTHITDTFRTARRRWTLPRMPTLVMFLSSSCKYSPQLRYKFSHTPWFYCSDCGAAIHNHDHDAHRC